MKLAFCPRCQDAFKLDYEMRQCKCGASKGKYEDPTNAIVFGAAIPFCVGWSSFTAAIKNRPDHRYTGAEFKAWIPPVNCDSITHEENNDERRQIS